MPPDHSDDRNSTPVEGSSESEGDLHRFDQPCWHTLPGCGDRLFQLPVVSLVPRSTTGYLLRSLRL